MEARMYCVLCGAETSLEQVPCEEGHGADCPEWLCVQCGLVVVLGEVRDERVRLGAA